MGLLSSLAGVYGDRSYLHMCSICGATGTGLRTSESSLQVFSMNVAMPLAPFYWQSIGVLEKKAA